MRTTSREKRVRETMMRLTMVEMRRRRRWRRQ
jgi:hypothetical protein